MAPQLEEDFADDVFGGRAVGDQPEHEVIDPQLMALEQQRNRSPIALATRAMRDSSDALSTETPGRAASELFESRAPRRICGPLTHFTVCG